MTSNFKSVYFVYWCSFLNLYFLIPICVFNYFTHIKFSQNYQFLIPLLKRLIILTKFLDHRKLVSLLKFIFCWIQLLHRSRCQCQDRNQKHTGHRHQFQIINFGRGMTNLKITKFYLNMLIHLTLGFQRGHQHLLDNMFMHLLPFYYL